MELTPEDWKKIREAFHENQGFGAVTFTIFNGVIVLGETKKSLRWANLKKEKAQSHPDRLESDRS